jgi:signal peptidase II
LLVGLLGLLVGCDHVTKYAVKTQLEGEHPHAVIRGVLDLRYTENTDVAFNLLRWVPETTRAPILAISGGLAVLCLLVLLLRRAALSSVTFALLLVTAGAVGNYADRVARGYVVDFMHVPYWPVFNVADIYVTLGAAFLAVVMLRQRAAHAPG